jgi:hypothetical protein
MKNTTENNKLIAQFLGQKVEPFEFPQFGFIKTNGDWKDTFTEDQLKFHKDWNWLMEVVEKIDSLKDKENNGKYYFEIYKTSVTIFCNGTFLNEIINTQEKTKIEAVYNACVEFIKWHNENNK